MARYPSSIVVSMVLLLCIFAAFHGWASERSPVDELLELSQIRQNIESYPVMLMGSIEQASNAGSRIEGLDLKELHSVVFKGFERANLLGVIRKDLEENLTPAKLDRLKEFFKEPLSKKVLDLEKELMTPDAFPALESFSKQIQEKPLSASRTALLERLDKDAGITEQGVRDALLVMGMTLRILDRLVPTERRKGEKVLQEAEAAARPQVEKSLKVQVATQIAFLFRSLDEKELETYTVSQEQDFVQEFRQVIRKAMAKGLEILSTELIAEADRFVQEKRAPAGGSATSTLPAR